MRIKREAPKGHTRPTWKCWSKVFTEEYWKEGLIMGSSKEFARALDFNSNHVLNFAGF